MRTSKENVTRVSTDEGMQVGTVTESAGHVKVVVGIAGKPLEFSAKEWGEFVTWVKALDRHVPASVGGNGKAAASPVVPTVLAPTITPGPLAARLKALLTGKQHYVRMTLSNGAHVRFGKWSYNILLKLAAEPERWWRPRDLALGRVGAETLWSLTATGLVDRSTPLRSGKGRRGTYKISEKGKMLLKEVGAGQSNG